MMVGMTVDVDPIPPILENTKMFDAGPVSFGVEYRVLNDEIVQGNYGAEETARLKGVPEYAVGDVIDDSGVSVHVFGADGREYLRFDCFADDPHYHYVLPDEPYQRFVPFDVAANGDPLTWTMRCLRSRLVPMLKEAGGTKSAEMIDAAVVADVLDRVEQTARSIVRSPN